MLGRLLRRCSPWRGSLGTPALFSDEGLERLGAHTGFRMASPYPHLVIYGLFNPEAIHAVLQEWPTGSDAHTEAHNDGTYATEKLGTTWQTPFGPNTRRYFSELGEGRFLKLLEKVTGMWGLIPDPYMFGGGLHATRAGGRLAVHADYNKHPWFKLDRRLNLLVYLNERWSEENGGWLELWDTDMRQCVKRVLPRFNTTVIFATTSNSFHAQPEPVVGSPELWRRSIALYYFSNGRADEGHPPEAADEHSTLWQERPVQDL
jgi:hypothetical protein